MSMSETTFGLARAVTTPEPRLQVDDTSIAADSSLYPASSRFPLGSPFGLVPAGDGVTEADSMPLGLRLATAHAATPVGDLSRYGYDTDRQIGIVRDGDTVVPLLKHTDGQTSTVTHPDGHQGNDTDQDVRED
jgi:putative ATP-grasp target RiPP